MIVGPIGRLCARRVERERVESAAGQGVCRSDAVCVTGCLCESVGVFRGDFFQGGAWGFTHKAMRRLFSDLHSWMTSSSSRSSSRVKLSLSSTSCVRELRGKGETHLADGEQKKIKIQKKTEEADRCVCGCVS